jgi:hypothetical protein
MPEAPGLGEGHQNVGWSPMSAEVVLVRVSCPIDLLAAFGNGWGPF